MRPAASRFHWLVKPRWLRLATVVAAVAGLALAVASPLSAEEPPRDQLWRFVDDVLFRHWFPETEESIRRWTHRPGVSLFSRSPEDEELLASLISQINSALAGTGIGLDFLGMGKRPADIYVLVFPKEEFPVLAQNFDIDDREYDERAVSAGGFGVYWDNGEYELVYGVAMVAAEAAGVRREAVMLRELLHALGPNGYSAVFPDSVFFASPPELSSATHLAPVDRKLLRFLYGHLEPGDTWVAVWEAFQRHWPE